MTENELSGTAAWLEAVCECTSVPATTEASTLTWVDATGVNHQLAATDTNSDGIADMVTLDANGDGLIDTWVYDTTGSGVADTMLVDSNRDGLPDGFSVDSFGTGAWSEAAFLPNAMTEPGLQDDWGLVTPPGWTPTNADPTDFQVTEGLDQTQTDFFTENPFSQTWFPMDLPESDPVSPVSVDYDSTTEDSNNNGIPNYYDPDPTTYVPPEPAPDPYESTSDYE